GGGLPQPKRSTVFKVHLSLFLLLSFFIAHLTLSIQNLRFQVCLEGHALSRMPQTLLFFPHHHMVM
ncbi:MAG: hypothetical protein KH204_03285, partial [[Eubacterium] rectale]|nr:hypothetical protein [Agathobacter rectalis]